MKPVTNKILIAKKVSNPKLINGLISNPPKDKPIMVVIKSVVLVANADNDKK